MDELLSGISADFTEWASVTVLPGVCVRALDLSVAIGKYSPVLLIQWCGKTAKVLAVWWLQGGTECKVPFWYRGYCVNQDLQIISDEIVLIAGGTRLYEKCLKTSALTLYSPSQKRFLKREKSPLMKTNPTTREACGEFNKPKFSFPRNRSRKYLIIQDLSINSLMVIIALLFSNASVFQRVICPTCFSLMMTCFFPALNISALIQEWLVYISLWADSSLPVTLQCYIDIAMYNWKLKKMTFCPPKVFYPDGYA